MKRESIFYRFILLLAFLILSFISCGASDARELKADDVQAIKAKDGEFVVVTGTVVGTFMPKSGKAVFLNFGHDYKTSFTGVIFSSNIDKFKSKFGADPVDFFLNKNVSIEGRVSVKDDRPSIILNDPSQIKVLGESKVEAEIRADDIEKIKSYDGKLITVSGTVKRVSKSKSGKVTFINFGDDWKSSFTVVVFSGDEEKFKDIGGLESLVNKNVKLTGVVMLYKDKPEIILKSPSQLKIEK